MRSLTYRTGAKSSRREMGGRRVKGSTLVEPTSKPRTTLSETSDPAMRKKVYLMFKNPLRGSYYYLKGARGKCKIGAERSAHGMRWNYYMRRGKCIPRIAPSIFSRSLLVSTGIMRSLRVEREGHLLVARSRKANRERKKRKTINTDERFSPLLRHKSPARRGEKGPGKGRMAEIISISVHPEYRPSYARQPLTAPTVRNHMLKRTAAPSSSRLPKARSIRASSSAARKVPHNQPKNSAARIEKDRIRLSREAKAAKRSLCRSAQKPSAQKARFVVQKASAPKQTKAPRMPASSTMSPQQMKTPRHVGYISSGEKKKAFQLKVTQTDPKPPR